MVTREAQRRWRVLSTGFLGLTLLTFWTGPLFGLESGPVPCSCQQHPWALPVERQQHLRTHPRGQESISGPC